MENLLESYLCNVLGRKSPRVNLFNENYLDSTKIAFVCRYEWNGETIDGKDEINIWDLMVYIFEQQNK